MTKRHVSPPEDVRESIEHTVAYVDNRLSADDLGRAVQELLVDLFGDRRAYERYRAGEPVSPLTRTRLQSYHPDNAVTESEHWAEQDPEKLREAKRIKFLWEAFDRSPLANDIAFALPFRQTLAEHLFAEAGENLRLFGGIKIQCGHNIRMGDNCVVHNDVLLDDRGELEIGDRVSVADRAHLHSHGHDVVDQTDVTTYRTVIEDDVRLGYDAMVNAGCQVGENAMVGASAMVRGDVPAHHVAVGSPAESVEVKPGWETVAAETGPLSDNRDDRRLDRTVPDDVDRFDEFGRDLSPPHEDRLLAGD